MFEQIRAIALTGLLLPLQASAQGLVTVRDISDDMGDNRDRTMPQPRL